MPSVCLDVKDLEKLPPEALSAIYSLFPEPPADSSDAGRDSSNDDFYPLSQRLAAKCLARPIDPKSVQLLKLVAENNGRVLWSKVQSSLGLARWQDLKGVLAGLNRRLRSITNDGDANLVTWDSSEDQTDASGEFIDGYLKVHPETAKSFRAYFGM